MQMMKMKRATIVAATSEPKYVIPEYISYINLDQSVPNIEEVITRLMVTMAMTKKLMGKICFIPFAELSILDVVFGVAQSCGEKVVLIFSKYNDSTYMT